MAYYLIYVNWIKEIYMALEANIICDKYIILLTYVK